MNEELFDGFVEAALRRDGQAESAEPDKSKVEETIASLPRCKGVIFFADEQGRAIQLLSSANIRRAAEVKLSGTEENNRSRKADISKIVSKIYYVCCYNNLGTALGFYECAKAVYPGNYAELVKVPHRYYICIDNNDKWPNFDLSENVILSKTATSFGPFISRKSAAEYIDLVRGVFGLCRRPELIAHPARSASCPYLQIGNCGAPCQGRLGYEEYLERTKKASEFVGGKREGIKEKLDSEMRSLAGEMKFEQAQQVKESLKKLEQLSEGKYKWIGDMTDFAVVHIDKSSKVEPKYRQGKRKNKGYEAFVIRVDGVWRSGVFTLFESAKAFKAIRDVLRKPLFTAELERKETSEKFAVATRELMKKGKMGVWLGRVDFEEAYSLSGIIKYFFKR